MKSRNYTVSSIAVIVACFFAFLAKAYELDDALIYRRYIDNALSGNGLVYNIGERWNALTSPLYTYLLLLLGWLTGSHGIAEFLIRTLSLAVAGIAGAQLLSSLGVQLVFQLLFIVLLQSSYFFLSTLGLETLLFCGLVGSSIALYLKERHFLLGIVSALLLLTRGESLFLLLILAGFHLLKRKQLPAPLTFVLPTLLLVLHIGFNTFYYGSPTPHTLTAKIAQGESGFWGEQLAFAKGLKIYLWYFGGRVSPLFVVALVTALYGVVVTRREIATRVAVLFSVLYSTFYLFLNIPFYHWYYGLFIFFGYLYLVIGCSRLSSFGSHERSIPTILSGALAVLITIFQTQYTVVSLSEPRLEPYRTLGQWFREHSPPESKIAAIEVGALGWYSSRPIIDILGLVSPHNAEFLATGDMTAWLSRYNPDYLVTHDPAWEQEQPGLELLMQQNRVRKVEGPSPKGFTVWQIRK